MYPLLGAKDVAAMLGVSERTVIRQLNEPESELRREARPMRVGKLWRFRRSNVEAYLADKMGPEVRPQTQLLRRAS